MKRTIFGVLLVAVYGFAAAADMKSQQSGCDRFAVAVEDGVKALAATAQYDGAANEVQRKLESNSILKEIQANLTLMQANKCQLPKDPVGSRWYFSAAFQCDMARNKALRAGDKQQPPECDRDRWVREPK
jgi:hypothetical protein